MSTLRVLSNTIRPIITNQRLDKNQLFPLLLAPFNQSTGLTQNKRFNSQHKTSPSSSTMRFIQFQRKTDSKIRLGSLSEDGGSFVDLSNQNSIPDHMIDFIKASQSTIDLSAIVKSDKWESTSDIELLAPITNPEKIVCIGLNYLGHCIEQNKKAPEEPMFFRYSIR